MNKGARLIHGGLAALTASACLAGLNVQAAEISSRGEIAVETRFFRPDEDPLTKDWGAGFASRLEAKVEAGPWRFKARGFGRVDQRDPSRGVMFVEESYVGVIAGPLTLDLGSKIINWSATEAFHPADTMNARNLDSNLENAEKYGEPMVHLNLLVGEGALNAYLMPYAISSSVPSSSNRLALLPAGVPVEGPLWLKRDGTFSKDEWLFQGALRLEYLVLGTDLAAFVNWQQVRDQPLLVFDPKSAALRPVFLPGTLYGLTTQTVLGGLLVKSEWTWREFSHQHREDVARFGMPLDLPEHALGAVGLEYTFYHQQAESTLVVEGQSVLGIGNRQEAAQLNVFQGDMLVGYRLAFNDVQSKSLFLSALWDLEGNEEALYNISYEQRLSDVWGIKLSARWFVAPPGPTVEGLEALDQDHHASMTLTRYF